MLEKVSSIGREERRKSPKLSSYLMIKMLRRLASKELEELENLP
jgi:hypothetical protein